MATGPFTTSSGSLSQIGGVHWTRTSMRGSKSTPHAYTYAHYKVDVSGGFFRPADTYDSMNFVSARTEASNRLYTNYRKKVDAAAAIAITLAERKQAYDMVLNRLSQFYRFLTALRKGRIDECMLILGVTQTPKEYRRSQGNTFRTTAKTWSGKVLEWFFGWAPLLSDVQSAYETLTAQEFPGGRARSRGQSSTYSFHNGVYPGPSAPFTQVTSTVKIKMQNICRLSVGNTDQLLMYQLGLTNPWQVGVELVPWSFVIGWFTNLGDCLKSLSPVYGIIQSGHHVTTLTYRTRQIVKRTSSFGPIVSGSGSSFVMSRELVAPPGPTFALKPFLGFSPTRGLIAVSLVLQQLKGR